MDPATWVAIITALLSYLAAKKSGASTGTAAAVAAAAGAGAYYVATETDWGKSFFDDNTGGPAWVLAKDANGNTVKDAQGRDVYVPEGETVTTDADGKVKVSADGSWFTKTLASTTDLLKSWGAAGTATVIGTTALATDSSLSKYLPWALGIGAVLLLTR